MIWLYVLKYIACLLLFSNSQLLTQLQNKQTNHTYYCQLIVFVEQLYKRNIFGTRQAYARVTVEGGGAAVL